MLECGGSSKTMSVAARFVRRCRVRHHQLGQHQSRRHADDGGDDQVPGGARQRRLQHGGVDRQHGAGHAGHADRHGGEQAAAAHGGEIGPHQQRRLDHADEHVGGSRRADRAGDAQRALQHPADAVHDLLQHAPVIEQLGERADHQDQRQRLEGQDEAGLGPHRVEGAGPPAR
jgi:hypothetical protein